MAHHQLPRLQTVPFDTPVLLFTIAMLVVCALGVGLAPVLQLAGRGIEERLAGAHADRRRHAIDAPRLAA